MSKYLNIFLILLFSFIATLPFFLPYDLIVSRTVFPFIENKTGIKIKAESIKYSFPFSLSAINLIITPNDQKKTSFIFDELIYTPKLQALTGNLSGWVNASVFKGQISLDFDQKHIYSSANDIELKELFKSNTSSQINGKMNFSTKIGFSESSSNLSFDGEIRVKDFSLKNYIMAGITLPKIEADELNILFSAANGAIKISRVQSIGGNVRISGEGMISAGRNPLESPIDIHLKLFPQRNWLNQITSSDRAINKILKPDGSLGLRMTGALSSPQSSFE